MSALDRAIEYASEGVVCAALRELKERLEALELFMAPRCLKCDRKALGNEGPPEHDRMCPKRGGSTAAILMGLTPSPCVEPPIVEPRVGQQFVWWLASSSAHGWRMYTVESIVGSYIRGNGCGIGLDAWEQQQRDGWLRVLPAAPEGGAPAEPSAPAGDDVAMLRANLHAADVTAALLRSQLDEARVERDKLKAACEAARDALVADGCAAETEALDYLNAALGESGGGK